MNSFRSSARQKGITLLEITIGIAIGMVISIMAITLATATRHDVTLQELQTQVMLVASQTQSAGQSSGTYLGVDVEMLVDTGRVPREWVGGSDGSWIIQHVLNGTIGISTQNIGSGTNNGATLIVNNLTIPACSSLLNNLQGNFVAIGRDAYADVRGVAAAPLSASQINAACTSGSDPLKTLRLTVR